MNAALCQAVTALPSIQESQEMLETLERANLFLVPLDNERRWYRYHHLFADLLRSGWGSGKVQQCRREMSSAFCQGQGRSAVPGSYRGFEAAGGSMKKDPGVAAPKGPGWD